MTKREIKKAFKVFVKLEGVSLDYFKDGYDRDDAQRYGDLLTRFARSIGIANGLFFISWYGDDSELMFEQQLGTIDHWEVGRRRSVSEPLAGETAWLDDFIDAIAAIRRISKIVEVVDA